MQIIDALPAILHRRKLENATAFFRPVNFPFFCNLYQYIVGTSSAPCLSKWHLSNMRFSSSSTNIYRGLHAERTSSQKESISISTWFRSHLDRDVLHNLYARRLISVPIAFRPSLLASMMVVPEPNIRLHIWSWMESRSFSDLCGNYLVCPSKAMLSSLLISARDTCLFLQY